jgi:hypothetical protein
MKVVFLLLFAAIIPLNAQVTEQGNIKVINNSVVYQAVKPITGNAKAQIIKAMHSGPFTDIDTTSLTCRINNYSIPFKRYGLSAISTAIYMRGEWVGTVTYEIKDGRYRVTANNLMVKDAISLDYGGGVTENPQMTPYEQYVMRSDFTLRGSQKQPIDIMNTFLDDILIVKEQTETDNNW